MDGPNSTSGKIPDTTSHPATSSLSPSQNQSGVNPLDGQRYTPASESTPAAVSIHMRTPSVQKGVLPQVNREKAIDQLQSSYKTHYAQAEAKRDQLELAHSLKEIRHYLDNPALAKECTSYSIMWIPDEGEPVSVIPPGTELNDRTRATEIRSMLHAQMDKLNQKFTVSKLQQLEEEIDEQEGLMQVAAQRLQEMGASLPKLSPRERIVLLGGASAKGIPVAGQPSMSKPLPETGQHTPSTAGTPPPKQPLETQESSTLPGQFELRLKKPDMPLLRPVAEDSGDFWDDLEDETPFPRKPQVPPQSQGSITEPERRARLGEEKTLFGSLKEQEEAQKPLIDIGDELDEEFDNELSHPLPQSVKRKQTPETRHILPHNAGRPRPKVNHPAPKIGSPLPVPPSGDVPAPRSTLLNRPYSTSYSPAGINAQPPEISRSKANGVFSKQHRSPQDTPVPPPSVMAQKLQECPSQIGAKLDANMGQLSSQAIRSIHQRDKTVNNNPLYNGPLHTARKAMLTRAMTNFHRKHAQDDGVTYKDAMHIPDSAIPAIELGVLSTKTASNAVLKSAGNVAQYNNTREKLIQRKVPEGTASVIATATTGYQSNPEENLLDSILRDVEMMESKRASSRFDICELQAYKLYTSDSARSELRKLCKEYYSMLAKQGDLPPLSKNAKGVSPSFLITEGDIMINTECTTILNPELRQYHAKRDDFYAHQVNQLKAAVAASSPQTTVNSDNPGWSSFGFSADGAKLETFGKLYTYSQGNYQML